MILNILKRIKIQCWLCIGISMFISILIQFYVYLCKWRNAIKKQYNSKYWNETNNTFFFIIVKVEKSWVNFERYGEILIFDLMKTNKSPFFCVPFKKGELVSDKFNATTKQNFKNIVPCSFSLLTLLLSKHHKATFTTETER